MSRLAQLPHFKEKTEALQEIPAGLFAYPTLQAADILLYKWVWNVTMSVLIFSSEPTFI